MTQNDEFEIDLLLVGKALWKKLWVIVLCAAVFGVGMFAYGKTTDVPMYAAQITMYIDTTQEKQIAFAGSNGSTTTIGLDAARKLVDTCSAMLQTRTVLEEVIGVSASGRTCQELSGMIATAAVNKTELFHVTVTSDDPQEAANLANAIAQVLPRQMAMVNASYHIIQVDSALVPSSPVPNRIVRNTEVAILMGAVLACAVIAAPDIWQQSKEWKSGVRSGN